MKGPRLAYPVRPLSQERPEASPAAAGDGQSPVTFDWASIEDDLEIVRRTKANLLVTGPECLVAKVIRRVVADAPALIGIPGEVGRLPLSPLPLPPVPVVFRDIDVVKAGRALNIDAYDQPAVELGKQATFGLMGRAGFEKHLKAVNAALAPHDRVIGG